MKKIIIFLLGMAIAAPTVFAATWYVSTNGNDFSSGTTWGSAKQTIQGALTYATDGDTVLVTNGTYVLTYQITVDKDVTVKSVNGASVTIVNGNYPVTAIPCFEVRYPGAANAIIDGFTITGGYSGSGGGIFNNGTVQNCIISGNITGANAGGGIYNTINGTMQNCIISGNTAYQFAGGVFNGGTMRNCTICGNSAYLYGGGVFNDGGTVQNCIVYYNENGDLAGDAPQYSCAPGLSGNGNISSDPQFIDPANGNCRLKCSSPCVNAGINKSWMAGAVDLDGNPRISYGRVDMGAYEFAIKNSTNICPVIKANGQTNIVTVDHSTNLTITVQIDPGQYQGAPVNWWVVALAGSSWYYLDSAAGWTQFDGNLSNCHPAYEGALFNLPETEALNMILPVGSYTFWFAVNYPMNGILNISEPILVSAVNVTIH